MFAITGITGQVGSEVAQSLLAAQKNIRAVVRNPDKAKSWQEQGCHLFVADMDDASALSKAFTGIEGVFILLPPTFDPSTGYNEARKTIKAIREALIIANPPKVVCLSTIGANSKQPNLLNQLGILEQELGSLAIPITFLRAAWFMENAAWDVPSAIELGIIHSFLQPLDKPIPMVATADVGRIAAETLQETWKGQRIINVESIFRISPNDIARSFSNILGKKVSAEIVPRETWLDLFISQGMKNPLPRIQMLDGFNQGWIEFDQSVKESRSGNISLDTVLNKITKKHLM